VKKNWMLLSPCLVTDATGIFQTSLEVHSSVACHSSHGMYSIALDCSIFFPFGISSWTENNVLFVFYSFPLYIKWRSFPGYWYSVVLSVTSYVHYMLVNVHCLTFKILSIEVLATIRFNILHNLSFQLALFWYFKA
jgi:hypothetical protein